MDPYGDGLKVHKDEQSSSQAQGQGQCRELVFFCWGRRGGTGVCSTGKDARGKGPHLGGDRLQEQEVEQGRSQRQGQGRKLPLLRWSCRREGVQCSKGREGQGGRARHEAEEGREEVRLHCPELVPRESPAQCKNQRRGEGEASRLSMSDLCSSLQWSRPFFLSGCTGLPWG